MTEAREECKDRYRQKKLLVSELAQDHGDGQVDINMGDSLSICSGWYAQVKSNGFDVLDMTSLSANADEQERPAPSR